MTTKKALSVFETDKPRKRLIVVLGMHRSGTSSLTRALLCLGVDLGNNLMKPHPDVNSKGFFEDMDLYALNEEMLKSLASAWHHTAPIRADEVAHLRRQGFFLRAVEWLRKKTGTVEIFGFKDPRIARLLPFWQPVFQHCGFSPDYILALRNPLAVAHSLFKRDAFPLVKGYLLWLEHMLTSLQGAQNSHCILADYDLLLDDPESHLQQLAHQLDLPLDAQALQEYESGFLDKALRHNQYTVHDMALDHACPPLVRDVYKTLLACSRAETPAASVAWHDQISSWWQELERTNPMLQLIDEFSERIQELQQGSVAQQAEWMVAIQQILQQQPSTLKPVFDAEWYQQQNPDVVAAGLDPYLHFVHDGAREGRWPAANLAAVVQQGLDNLLTEHIAEQHQSAAERADLDAEYQTRLQTLQHQQAEREQSNNERMEELRRLLQQMQAQATAREGEHSSLQQQLQRELIELQQQHTEREREVAAQLLALQQKSAAERADLDAEYQTRLQTLQHQQAEREQSNNTLLFVKQDELAQLSQRWLDAQQIYAQSMNQLEQQLQTIRASYTWRWTAPLRSVAQLFIRVFVKSNE